MVKIEEQPVRLNLKQKLVKVREHIGVLKKDTKGPNYMYADPAAMLGLATHKMNELGVLLTSNVINSTLTREPNPTKNKPNAIDFCVTLTMEMIFHDSDTDEFISIPWFAVGTHATDPAQAGGGALTYAERYFFLKQFNVPTTADDPDRIKEKSHGSNLISDEQAKQITDMMAVKRVDSAKFLQYLKVATVGDLMASRFNAAMNDLKMVKEVSQ